MATTVTESMPENVACRGIGERTRVLSRLCSSRCCVMMNQGHIPHSFTHRLDTTMVETGLDRLVAVCHQILTIEATFFFCLLDIPHPLSLSLPACLPVSLPACLPTCLSVCLLTCLSLSLSLSFSATQAQSHSPPMLL